MIPALVVGQAVLAAALLLTARLSLASREKAVRGLASIGAGTGLVLSVMNDGIETWRGMALAPEHAVVSGLAIACTWGLVIALDLGQDRWWVGALAGVAGSALVGFAAAQWTSPALLFLACVSAATCLAAARVSRAGWLTLAAADAAMAGLLIADVAGRQAWALPGSVAVGLLVGLLASAALRVGLIPRVGPMGLLGSPASVMGPIGAALALIAVSRWAEPPHPVPAAAVLLFGLGIASWSILHRRVDPPVVGVWPVALGVSLLLVSETATIPAAVSVVLGVTMVCLWPDALERGRLSRGLLISGMAPTVSFGAVGIGAREAFIRATEGGEPIEVGAWIAVSALLPVSFATGVALGVFVARTEPAGGYHPEAVFMTWILAAAAGAAGFVLGPREMFGALGGSAAAILFGIAASLGAFAAVRARVDASPPEPSSAVVLSETLEVGAWAPAVAVSLHIAGAGAIAWFTIEGLQVGFL